MESSTRVWHNQDQHTNITHQIGMAHSPCPPLTLRGRKVETGHPISSRHLRSWPHFHPPNTPGAPSPAWSQPGWAFPQHLEDRSQPVHQSPPAPDCPILPEAPRRRQPAPKDLSHPYTQHHCDPAVHAYSGSFISPASSRNLDMLAPGMRRCGKAFQSDVPAASLITTPGVARDF